MNKQALFPFLSGLAHSLAWVLWHEARVGRSSSLNGPLWHTAFERSHFATPMLGLENSLQSFYDLYKFAERGLVSDWALSLSGTD